MKFYEQMDPIKREAMILCAVAFNVAMEGMEESKQRLLKKAEQIKSQVRLSVSMEKKKN